MGSMHLTEAQFRKREEDLTQAERDKEIKKELLFERELLLNEREKKLFEIENRESTNFFQEEEKEEKKNEN